MASGFNANGTQKCQHHDGREQSQVATYLVKEKQDLCDDCATSKQNAIVKERGSIENEWLCEKHQKPMELVCRSHDGSAALCQTCAFVSHQKPCEVQDLQDVVNEKRALLKILLSQIEQRRRVLQNKESMIRECGDELEGHFKSIGEQISASFAPEMEKISTDESQQEERIQKEAEEQRRKLEEQIKERLRESKEQFEAKRQEITKSEQKTTDELLTIQKKASYKINAMVSQVKSWSWEIDDAKRRIERLLHSDIEVMKEAEQVESAWSDANRDDVDVDLLQLINRIGKRVQFEARNSSCECKLLGTKGSWELIDTVPLPKELMKPYFIGSIDENQMVVSDIGSRTLHVTNLQDRTTQKVLDCLGDRNIVSCMSLDEGTILCGNYCKGAAGRSFKGASLYNKDWELIRDVEVPKKRHTEKTFASVRVDKSGRILAAVATDSDIHIINPKDGAVVDTVSVDGKKIQWLSSSSSGKFFAKTGNGEFVILDSLGKQESYMRNDKWDGCLCDAHPCDDTVFVVYRDRKRRTYAVDEVMCADELQARKIVEYPLPTDRKDVVLPCIAMRKGRLVTCNGDNFFVFKLLNFDDI